MKFHLIFILAIIALFGNSLTVSAQINAIPQSQIDSVIGQITNSTSESFAGGISGDGRLVVFESIGNLATENPRNADGNREIFLFDYAQRRIFQITDTRSLRINTTLTYASSNIRVVITNVRPVISNDGRWIAFGSNATTSTPTAPNATNPGNFDAESFTPTATMPPSTNNNPLLADGNTEMWLYPIPTLPAANLSAGEEIDVTDLSGGTFTRATNTLPSRLPFPGSANNQPVIGDDNRDASISDNGNFIAFVSNRDLSPDANFGNASPNANDEIFTFARSSALINQITVTARGTIVDPIYNQNPSISGNGTRVAFLSNADNPIRQMSGGANSDRNVEIFYADLDGSTGGTTTGSTKRQVTTTTRTNPGDIVNVLDFGRRMSRDGRYIAFDSYADLAVMNGTNQTSFALYLYDTMTASFRQIGPRSTADASAGGGDVAHFPGFTDTDANGTPATLVLETRQNIRADGTVAANNADGLNPNTARPVQIYAYPLNVATTSANFVRLTTFPTPSNFIATTQPIPSNSVRRMTFHLALTEFGTGNPDLASEVFYFLLPTFSLQTVASSNYSTGASRIPVSASPVPTLSPTPTPSPLPSPSPTPITPSAVQGVSPGMLAILDYIPNADRAFVARTAVGSLSRSFTLPIELSGVTMTINGAAVGIKSVKKGQIVFVVPPGLTSALTGTTYPVVVNNNGIVFRGSITIVPTRPDIFTFSAVPAPNGRARIFNVTNTVFRTEPFTVTTLRIRGGRRVPTVLRLFLTGVNNVPTSLITVRVGSVSLIPINTPPIAVLREPGVYSIDFALTPELRGAGDVPIIVTVNVNGVLFQSRLDDTAPRFSIL